MRTAFQLIGWALLVIGTLTGLDTGVHGSLAIAGAILLAGQQIADAVKSKHAPPDTT